MDYREYGEAIFQFQQDFERLFVKVLELDAEYSRLEVAPGDRFGFIDWYEQDQDTDFRAKDYEVLTGQYVITLGGENRTEIDRLTSIERQRLYSLPALALDMLSSIVVYDIENQGSRVSNKHQNIAPPHHWIVDIAGAITAKLLIKKDSRGNFI